MIGIDGTEYNLVPYDSDPFVEPWERTNGAKGYNSKSIHVALVGGLSANGKESKDTKTKAQEATLIAYIKKVKKTNSKIRVIGHNEISGKDCPSFDVQAWLVGVGLK